MSGLAASKLVGQDRRVFFIPKRLMRITRGAGGGGNGNAQKMMAGGTGARVGVLHSSAYGSRESPSQYHDTEPTVAPKTPP